MDTHEQLLDALRTLPTLTEKSPGRFYRRSRAFLHFHGKGEDLCADVRLGDDWERLPAARPDDRAALAERVALFLAEG